MNGRPSLRSLHTFDLHFGPPFRPVVGEALLDKAELLESDGLVTSGDFTQRAKPEQFAAAAEFLKRLPPVPQIVVPGNHDVPQFRVFERFMNLHGLYRKHISEESNPVLHIDRGVIVGLDTSSPSRKITKGRIRRWQLDRCSDAFKDAPPDAARSVVAHHHFAPAPDHLRDWAMPTARRAIDRFLELGVELIFGGDLHRADIGNPLDFFPGRHRKRGIITVQSGTTTSRRGRSREREKNSFNLIDVSATTHSITHYVSCDGEHGFTPFSRHQFPPPGTHFEHDVLLAAEQTEYAGVAS
jgi:3',5'-cyclic AMP phosphodiesterase CpdA